MVLTRRKIAAQKGKAECDAKEAHAADEAEPSYEGGRSIELGLCEEDGTTDAKDDICEGDNVDDVAMQGDGADDPLKSESGAEGNALDASRTEIPGSNPVCESELPGKNNASTATTSNSELNLSAEDKNPAVISAPVESSLETTMESREPPSLPVESKKRKRSSSKKSRTNESAVVYLSRVPPGMDVGALRALLSRTGTLGRVWLRAEDASTVSARRQLGGRRRGGFSDGWVEYARRRDARNAVELLNGRPMAGAKRGGRWKNDLWCLKLLQKGFSWDDLVEETCGSKRERILKVKAAVAASRREKAFVEERAELAKRIAMKEGRLEAERGEDGEDGEVRKKLDKRIVRRFRQKEAVEEMEYEDDVDERRAREAAMRLEEGEMEGAQKKAKVDAELVRMLFGKKGAKAKSASMAD